MEMDLYHAFFDTKPGVSDMQLVSAVDHYMDHLRAEGLIVSRRLTRAKLGFGLKGHGDWHLVIEVRDLTQLQAAFDRVASRAGAIEGFHFGMNSLVQNAVFALYRDFPDSVRQRGEERF
jgi:hypothetical protein